MLLARRLSKLRKAEREGRTYSPRTKEMREAKARRKLQYRLLQVLYGRRRALGWRPAWESPARRRSRRVQAAQRSGRILRARRTTLTPQERTEARRVYRLNRKLRRTGRGLWPGFVKMLLMRQGHHCVGCGGRLLKFHLDHIEPLARGGSHEPENLQLLCPPCNLRKGAKSPLAFMRECGFLF
jgi:5-methylcytosine-specific restriction endonuclease McrA